MYVQHQQEVTATIFTICEDKKATIGINSA